MLKPTSAFEYVIQEASTSAEGACWALTVELGEGDCGLFANELHDTTIIKTMRETISFFILEILKTSFGVSRRFVSGTTLGT